MDTSTFSTGCTAIGWSVTWHIPWPDPPEPPDIAVPAVPRSPQPVLPSFQEALSA